MLACFWVGTVVAQWAKYIIFSVFFYLDVVFVNFKNSILKIFLYVFYFKTGLYRVIRNVAKCSNIDTSFIPKGFLGSFIKNVISSSLSLFPIKNFVTSCADSFVFDIDVLFFGWKTPNLKCNKKIQIQRYIIARESQ